MAIFIHSSKTKVTTTVPGTEIMWIKEHDVVSAPEATDIPLDVSCCDVDLPIINSHHKYKHHPDGSTTYDYGEVHQLLCSTCHAKIKEIAHAVTPLSAANWLLPFGKHKGVRLKDAPKDYLIWCRENLESRAIKKKISCYLDSLK